jgi:intracellular septation protein A
MCVLDVAIPLGLFYGLRLAGVNQWLALVLSGALPAVRLIYKILTEHQIEMLTLFTLSIVGVGTAVALLTPDPRLVLARESYITALLGLWMLSTLLAQRPFIFAATVRLMPEPAAEQWQRDWRDSSQFRKAMRVITIAWGCSFLADAAARVVMAYTLPVDIVPLLSVILLVVMLILVVVLSKEYGRRQLLRQHARQKSLKD